LQQKWVWQWRNVLKREDIPMATFQRPCSGFTASDLISLRAIWPDGKHEWNADSDHFVVSQSPETNPWLVITRHRDGTYLSHNLSRSVYAQGRSLADLTLDGCDHGDSVGGAVGRIDR
jgi:hypothetical protein